MKHKDGSVTIEWKVEDNEAVAGIISNFSHFRIDHDFENDFDGDYPYHMTLWVFFGDNDGGTKWDMGDFKKIKRAQKYAESWLRKLGVKVR